MFKVIGFIYLVSWIAMPLIAIWDTNMHPICPECGDNLSAKRLKFRSKIAYCKKHGLFGAAGETKRSKAIS